MTESDWPDVARIYGEGISTGTATFEHTVPSWEHWCARRAPALSLVARDGQGVVLGWVSLSRTSLREVYRGVGQLGIYVDSRHARRGIGRTLLGALIERSEQAGFWTLQAGIFPENVASVALHESCGFRLVGVHERIGRTLDGRWRDVALYERRSEAIGKD